MHLLYRTSAVERDDFEVMLSNSYLLCYNRIKEIFMLANTLYALGFEFMLLGRFTFVAAFAVAFLIILIFGNSFIRQMQKWQNGGQPIQADGPDSHKAKAGTPTMGGILILGAIFASAAAFMDWGNPLPLVALAALGLFGAIGFVDDYGKIRKRSSDTSAAIMSPAARLILGGIFAVGLAYFVQVGNAGYVPELSVYIPVLNIFLYLGLLYFVWAFFVIVGAANAVNITDGLDGLLSKIILPVLVVIVASVYAATQFGFMSNAVFLPGATGLYPLIGAVLGAVIGFLWFNAKPAKIFMGDVGSLALGAFLGVVAMQLNAEFIIGIASVMMVIILLSSFIQIIVFKTTRKITGTGKRVFKMAPLHHHLELSSWAETRIVERFFILSILFSAVALGVLIV